MHQGQILPDATWLGMARLHVVLELYIEGLSCLVFQVYVARRGAPRHPARECLHLDWLAVLCVASTTERPTVEVAGNVALDSMLLNLLKHALSTKFASGQ